MPSPSTGVCGGPLVGTGKQKKQQLKVLEEKYGSFQLFIPFVYIHLLPPQQAASCQGGQGGCQGCQGGRGQLSCQCTFAYRPRRRENPQLFSCHVKLSESVSGGRSPSAEAGAGGARGSVSAQPASPQRVGEIPICPDAWRRAGSRA